MDQSSLGKNLRFVGLVPGLEARDKKKALLLLIITYRPRIYLLSALVPCDGDMEQTSKLPILEQTHALFTCAYGYVLCPSGWLLSIIGGMSPWLVFVCLYVSCLLFPPLSLFYLS